MSVTIPEILVALLGARVLGRRRALDRDGVAASPGSATDAASLYLKPGDVMEAEIERIGVLRNPVVSWQEAHGEPPPPRVRPRGEPMAWPRDDAKLERVRALMAEEELDALVVRAPDNVLYLTNFWGMKGYDAVVFPREGEPTLICLEASAEDAARTAWTTTSASSRGYDDDDPRPPLARTLDARARRPRATTSASASSSRSARRPPTAWSASRRPSRRRWFDAFGRTPPTRRRCSRAARAIKTEQEIERMRLANEIAAAAMEHVPRRAPAGDEGERGGGALARLRPRRGHRLEGTGRARARLLARLVGPGHPDVHRDRRPAGAARTSRRCSRSGSAPTATGATTRRTSAPASSTPRYAELARAAARASTSARVDHCRPGASLAELDRLVRDGHRRGRLSRPADPPDRHGVGARAHEPPYAHQAGGGHDRGGHGAGDRARDLLGGRRRPARRGQLPHHRGRRREAVVVPGRRGRADDLDRRAERRRTAIDGDGRPLRHDAPRRRADRRRRPRPGAEARDRRALLDELGIERIEAGFPRVSQDDWRRGAS